jgi:hypothetical protein
MLSPIWQRPIFRLFTKGGTARHPKDKERQDMFDALIAAICGCSGGCTPGNEEHTSDYSD